MSRKTDPEDPRWWPFGRLSADDKARLVAEYRRTMRPRTDRDRWAAFDAAEAADEQERYGR